MSRVVARGGIVGRRVMIVLVSDHRVFVWGPSASMSAGFDGRTLSTVYLLKVQLNLVLFVIVYGATILTILKYQGYYRTHE